MFNILYYNQSSFIIVLQILFCPPYGQLNVLQFSIQAKASKVLKISQMLCRQQTE